jgi:heme-degrading monooxygenase HmoA
MITEFVKLNIINGRHHEFEANFKLASKIISRQKGYVEHKLLRSEADQHTYILLATWNSIEDHREGFRKSTDYQEWKKLLHHYYDPFPLVEYYSTIFSIE